MEDSFGRLLALPDHAFTPRVAETIANLATATQRINAEFLDTKAFLRAVMINITSKEVQKSAGGTQVSLPNPFWMSSCATQTAYETFRVWKSPHLQLVNGNDLLDCNAEFAGAFGTQLGQHPFSESAFSSSLTARSVVAFIILRPNVFSGHRIP